MMSGVLRLLNDTTEGYFKHNKIETGESIPTSGTYKKGDIIVNVSRFPSDCPLWLCVYDGTPGRWIEVGKVTDLPEDVLRGVLSKLETDDKSNIINAVNEVVRIVKKNASDISKLTERMDGMDTNIIESNKKINEIFNKLK